MPLLSSFMLKEKQQQQFEQQPQNQHAKTAATTTMLPIINETLAEESEEGDDYSLQFASGLDNADHLNSTTLPRSLSSCSSLCSQRSNCSQEQESITMISDRPSNASKHFENTVKLLGKHLETKCQRSADRLQKLDTQSNGLDSLGSNSCASMSAIINGTEPAPTRLELELEAVERMRVIVQQMKTTPKKEESALVTASAPLLALLHDFAAKGQPCGDRSSCTSTPAPSPITGALPAEGPNFEIPAELLDAASSWELMYYASKNVDGKNCLKVVRSLLTNKGKLRSKRWIVVYVTKITAAHLVYIYLTL